MVAYYKTPYYAKGFTYLGVLFAVSMLGVSLALVGSSWKTSQQRESEQELLFVGDQFRKAIILYYERTPGFVKTYPKSFEQLIKDDRYITPQRYLRRVYRDPMTLTDDWGIVRSPDGGMMGVYSLSDKVPRKTARFPEKYAEFAHATRYSEWQFVYHPTLVILPNTTPAQVHQ